MAQLLQSSFTDFPLNTYKYLKQTYTVALYAKDTEPFYTQTLVRVRFRVRDPIRARVVVRNRIRVRFWN